MRHGCPRRRYRRPDGTFRVPHLDDVYAGLAADRLRPVLDQRAAMQLLTAACAARRSDGRRTHAAVSFALACAMDHSTGAITATHDQLGETAARRLRRDRPYSHDTVARVVAVLVDAGVLVLPPGMEGKSAAALRSRVNQAPTYFVVAPVTTDQVDTERDAGGDAGWLDDVDDDDDEAVAAAAALIAARLDAKLAGKEGAADQPERVVAYPSHSRRESGLTVVDHYSFYEGQDRKRSKIDPRTIPATTTERRQAADWLRAELKIGVVPTWRLDAMLARHWRAGLTIAAVKHMICHRPQGRNHGELPLGAGRADAVRRSPKDGATVVDVLLGCVGYRLNLWRDTSPPAALGPRVVRPAASQADPAADRPTGPTLTRAAAYALATQAIAQARARAKGAARM